MRPTRCRPAGTAPRRNQHCRGRVCIHLSRVEQRGNLISENASAVCGPPTPARWLHALPVCGLIAIAEKPIDTSGKRIMLPGKRSPPCENIHSPPESMTCRAGKRICPCGKRIGPSGKTIGSTETRGGCSGRTIGLSENRGARLGSRSWRLGTCEHRSAALGAPREAHSI
jgi:hypothetical protein